MLVPQNHTAGHTQERDSLCATLVAKGLPEPLGGGAVHREMAGTSWASRQAAPKAQAQAEEGAVRLGWGQKAPELEAWPLLSLSWATHP